MIHFTKERVGFSFSFLLLFFSFFFFPSKCNIQTEVSAAEKEREREREQVYGSCCLVAVVDRSSTRAGFHHDEVTLVLLVLNSLSNYIQSYARIIPAAN
jgi:hypothetical protein